MLKMEHRLYQKNKEKQLDPELFRNPTKEYRGAPFWAWNTKPQKEEMERQMQAFADMGFGGFHMHSRTGLDVPYLGDEFMDDVRFCVEYAAQNDMLAWAYDEDRFPSGFAGGLVTKDKKYRYRELLWTPKEIPEYMCPRPEGRAEESYLIGIYDVELDADGYLKAYRKIENASEAKGALWYGYLRVAMEDSWFNNQTYVDTMDVPSIERFCEVTHERYKEVVGEYFGSVIPSFFTDEPKTTYKKTLPFATDRKNLIMPWTDDFPDTFRETYHMEIENYLPELFWELPGGQPSTARYLFHRHASERFAKAYSETISRWCEQNGVCLTGHMIKEPSLKSQSTAVGESMAPLSPFGFPGIDMLCNEREYTTAKQAQSIMHQCDREAMVSELYGVTNWDFDFRGHKTAGDWQAALGVSIRVPHLSWMTMEGEAKRDYPASIHYQSPWYKEYRLVENHFARVNTAMTRGNAIVRIGMIHPVESYWCMWGPEEHTGGARRQLDDNFQQLTEWLLFEHYDFDYISEAVLPKLYEAPQTDENGVCRFRIGASAYDVVLVPGCRTLRSTTADALLAFAKAGGKVLFAGEIPALIDGAPDDRLQKACAAITDGTVECIPYDKSVIITHLKPYAEVELLDGSGNTCSKHIYQLRQDGDDQWLFIVYAKKKARYDCEGASWMKIKKPGIWYPVLYDTMTGETKSCIYSHENGMTVIAQKYYVQDSILIRLCREKQQQTSAEEAPLSGTASFACDLTRVPVTLEEPNVAVLDRAQYAVDDEEWKPEEEVLRIGQICREAYGITPQGGRMAQPWTMKKPPMTHKLHLRFTIESEIDIPAPKLALEQAEKANVFLNGEALEGSIDGWYVDTAIQTMALPPIKAGSNTLDITLPFGENANVENAFLLGEFGVRVEGSRYVLTAQPKKIAFGDITAQGFPFYGGNLTYHLTADTPEGDFAVRSSYFRGALIGVSVDGKRMGSIAFAPYRCEVHGLEKGTHAVDLKLFGTRINTFGTLHNCNENTTWFGPDAWRTTGDGYSTEYQLKRVGILKRPEIE